MSSPPDPTNRGPELVRAMWIMDSIAGIVVALRIFTGLKIHKRLTWSDGLMVAAWLCGITNNALVTVSTTYGLGRHIEWLAANEPQNIPIALKFNTIPQPIGIMCPTLARTAFAMYMLTLVGPKPTMRIILHVTIWVNLAVNVINAILIWPQCSPVAKIWDDSLPGHCWPKSVQTDLGFWQGAMNTITDIVMTAIPTVLVWNLQMTTRLKAGVAALLGLSVFAAACSIVKTIELKNLGSTGDITWDLVSFAIWFTVENNVVIIAASIPTIRPLFRRNKNRSGTGSSGYIHGKDGTYAMNYYGNNPRSRGYIRSEVGNEESTGDIHGSPDYYKGAGIMKNTSIVVQSRTARSDLESSEGEEDQRPIVGLKQMTRDQVN